MHEPGGRNPNPDVIPKPDADGLPPRAAGSPPEPAPPATDPEDSPYRGLPWPLVAGVLAAVLLLALGGGIFANRYIRQPTVVLPAPTREPVSTAQTTAPVTQPATVSAPAASVTQGATVAPTAVPLATVLEPTQIATQGRTPTATVDRVLAAEVEHAYERYWQVRARALLVLDASQIANVTAGRARSLLEEGIDELRAERQAVRTRVQHNYRVLEVGSGFATVLDQYIDDSIYVDPVTQEPIGGANGEPVDRTVRELYRFERIDEVWKVVDVASVR